MKMRSAYLRHDLAGRAAYGTQLIRVNKKKQKNLIAGSALNFPSYLSLGQAQYFQTNQAFSQRASRFCFRNAICELARFASKPAAERVKNRKESTTSEWRLGYSALALTR